MWLSETQIIWLTVTENSLVKRNIQGHQDIQTTGNSCRDAVHVQQGSTTALIVLHVDTGLDKFNSSHPSIQVGNFTCTLDQAQNSGDAKPKCAFDW